MAFVFPEDKQDFKAPNGITYTHDGEKWLIKTFKTPPPPPTDLSGHVTTEEFEQDQNRQNIRLDDLDQEVEGLNNSQGVQDDQINVLETQVQLLAQVQAVGKWTYVRNITGSSIRPPATATFYGTHVDGADTVLRDWSDLRLIMISKTDINGTTYAFADFQEGDKIEILDTDGSSACYGTVTNNPNQESYGNLAVAVERFNSGPRDNKEYIVSVYRPGASGGEVDLDILDGRYLAKTGGTLTGQIISNRDSGAAFRVQKDGVDTASIWTSGAFETERTSFLDKQLVPKWFMDVNIRAATEAYLPLAGGTLTAPLTFKRGDKDSIQYKISPNSGSDFATNIYSLGNGQMRLRTSHTNDEGDHVGSHIVLDPNDGVPTTKIYHVATPTTPTMAANKEYVDGHSGGVPVGAIMMWINGAAPAGWFKCKGGDFDISRYPLLHAYLQLSDGYVSGKLPDWRGHYPGQLGDHLNGDVGVKLGQRTAIPNAGAPYPSTSIPNGASRTFNGAGGTSAYSNGTARPAITEGWDDVTRPKTVAVHFIIKHD